MVLILEFSRHDRRVVFAIGFIVVLVSGMLHWVSSGTLLEAQECHQVALGEAVIKGLNDDGLMNLGGRMV